MTQFLVHVRSEKRSSNDLFDVTVCSFHDVVFKADCHASWRVNHGRTFGVNCIVVFPLKFPDAIKTLGLLCNQILLVSNQGGFFGLLKSLIL